MLENFLTMPESKLLDDQIAYHLNQLNPPQKQVILVVLKTMSEQNKTSEKSLTTTGLRNAAKADKELKF